MRENERLKRRFLELYSSIERSNWLLSAFYGDDDVSRINRELIERWIKAGRSGEPIDYASRKELSILIRKARFYSALSAGDVIRNLMYTDSYSILRFPRSGWLGKLFEVIRRLFLPTT